MMSTKSAVAQRWLPRAGLLSAAFTTLCCLGISAALSLARALVHLAVFGPLQSAHAGHHDHAQAHHASHAGMHDNASTGGVSHDAMHDAARPGNHHDAPATAAGAGGGGGALVWVGLAALIAAQLWDAVRVRRCSAVQHPTPKGAL